jgi:hypothetical protein
MFILLGSTFYYYSKGFQIQKIDEQFVLNLPQQTIQFNDPFFLKAKGSQMYVFEDHKNQYVAKIVRSSKLKPPFHHRFLCFLLKNSSKQIEIQESYVRRKIKLMNSLNIAYKELKNETALIDVAQDHIHLIGPFGKEIPSQYSSMIFIQPYMPSLREVFLKLKREKNRIALQHLIDDLFEKLQGLAQKHILQKDYHILENCGVLEQQVYFRDIGSFAYSPKDPSKIFKQSISRINKSLSKWLEKNDPELLFYYQKKIEKLIK